MESSKTTTVRVNRSTGTCSRCKAPEARLVEAYDPRIYAGKLCAGCILSGDASTFAVDHAAMRPMVFVARALTGEEPFASMVKAADRQRKMGAPADPVQAAKAIAAAAAGLPGAVRNRKERRAAEKREKLRSRGER